MPLAPQRTTTTTPYLDYPAFIGSSLNDQTSAIASNSFTQDVYFGGYFRGTTFTWTVRGRGSLTAVNSATTGSADAWFGKYNSISKDVVWIKSLGSASGDESINALAVDGTGQVAGNGDVYAIGDFGANGFDPGSGALTNVGGLDVWVAKFDSTGTTIWAVAFGSDGADSGRDITISNDATSLFIVGHYYGTSISFGNTTLSNGGLVDGFIAKLDAADGTALWVIRVSGNAGEQVRSVYFDRSSSYEAIAVTGYIASATWTIGSLSYSNLFSGLLADVFVTRINGTGGIEWVKRLAGSGSDTPQYLSVHESTGNIYFNGQTTSTSITWGGTTVTKSSSSIRSIFVASISANGAERWLKVFQGSATDIPGGISVDNATEQVYVGATMNSSNLVFGLNTVTTRSIVFSLTSTGTVLTGNQIDGANTAGTNTVMCAHVDSASNVWIGGTTAVADTCSLANVIFSDYGGSMDAFSGLYDRNLTAIPEPMLL